MKIFGVGMCKTGTVSLGRAFEILGYRHCHGSFITGNKLLYSYLSGDYGPIYDMIDGYDTFEDFPFCAAGAAEILDKKYPDAKFILTTRESGSWYHSMFRYLPNDLIDLRSRDGLPLGPYYGLTNYMLATFGSTDIKSNKELFVKGYEQYNQRIKDLFEDRPEKLLVVCWMEGDGWAELCDFLDKPLPALNGFPRVNINGGHGIK